MPRLWARIIKKHRIEKQATVECAWGDAEEALTELCLEFDISRPLWLNKHCREFEEFRRTQFLIFHCFLLYVHVRSSTVRVKKPAKLLLFFELTKYFGEKMHFFYIFLRNVRFT